MMTRAEHLAWAKTRALEYVDQGDVVGAMSSMQSDLFKHPETAGHQGIELMRMLAMAGHMQTPAQVREFIEVHGFIPDPEYPDNTNRSVSVCALCASELEATSR